MPVTFTLRDRSGESTTSFFATSNDATFEADFTAALAGLVYPLSLQSTTVSTVTQVSTQTPANNLAQRENKLLFSLRDTVTGLRYVRTVGVFDMSTVNFNGLSDEIIIPGTGTPIDDAVTAINTYVLSNQGNQVIVEGARFVGRNS